MPSMIQSGVSWATSHWLVAASHSGNLITSHCLGPSEIRAAGHKLDWDHMRYKLLTIERLASSGHFYCSRCPWNVRLMGRYIKYQNTSYDFHVKTLRLVLAGISLPVRGSIYNNSLNMLTYAVHVWLPSRPDVQNLWKKKTDLKKDSLGS